MRSSLVAAFALLVASGASASGAPSLEATPAAHPPAIANTFENWLLDPPPLFTELPPRDSLIAWHAQDTTLRARAARPLSYEWTVDTAATHIHLEMPRLLHSSASEYFPALLAQVVDLDGDVFPEVVSVSPTSNEVTIHMDALADDAERRVTVPLPGYAFGMAAGDLDRDGLPDLVCSTWKPDGLVILRGLGGGTFAPPVTYPTGPGARGLALADLDGDGDLDIALACAGDSTVRVFLGRGDGAFDAGVTCPVGDSPAAVLASDVTGDGRLDLVSMDQGMDPASRSLSCLVNLGAGAFGPRVTSLLPWRACAIAAGDLDGDGRTDVAMNGYGGSLVLLGDGTGRFVIGPTLSTNGGQYNAGVAIADLDGDGRSDVVVGEAGIQRGATFAMFGVVHIHRGLDGGGFEAGPGYRTVGALQSLSLGDVDRDGLPDVLAAGAGRGWPGGDPGVTVLLQRPDHRLRSLAEYGLPQLPSSGYSSGIHSARAVRLGGSVDDLIAVTVDRIQLMVNQGARGFAAPVEVGVGAVCAVRDLDLDGLDDVLVQSGDVLGVLRGGAGHTLAPGQWSLSAYFYIAVGQFGGDAFPDLIVRDASGALFLARGVGGGEFAAPVPTGAAIPADPRFGFGNLAGNGVDLDRDDVDEMVVFRQRDSQIPESGDHAPDTLDVFRCLTSGALERVAMVAVPWPPRSYWAYDLPHQVLSADFDGDGWRDLLAVRYAPDDCCTNGSYCALMNRGDGSLRVAESGWTRHGLSEAAIADLDGDRRDDILFSAEHSMDTGVLQWLVSDDDGTFSGGSRDDVGDYLTSVTAGRFDEDTRPDVAVASGRDVVVGVILNGTPWLDHPTPVLASLVSASVEAGVARIVWSIDASPSAEAVVLRSEGGAWVERGRFHAEGDGRVRFEDAQVSPGARYGYRLALAQGGAWVVVSETWLDVPAEATLALAGASPNPVVGDLTVAFSLAGNSPASLTGYDVTGRRVAEREVGALGPGRHRVRLAATGELPAGLYFIRLATPERTLFARAVVVR